MICGIGQATFPLERPPLDRAGVERSEDSSVAVVSGVGGTRVAEVVGAAGGDP